MGRGTTKVENHSAWRFPNQSASLAFRQTSMVETDVVG